MKNETRPATMTANQLTCEKSIVTDELPIMNR
jgi:hypothetical protein